MNKKELLRKMEKLEFIIKSQEQTIKDLEHFIKNHGLVCPDCGYSGADCHNYQG